MIADTAMSDIYAEINAAEAQLAHARVAWHLAERAVARLEKALDDGGSASRTPERIAELVAAVGAAALARRRYDDANRILLTLHDRRRGDSGPSLTTPPFAWGVPPVE